MPSHLGWTAVIVKDNPYFSSVVVMRADLYVDEGRRCLQQLDINFILTQPLQLTFMESTHQISTVRLQLHNEYLGQSSLVWQSFWGEVSLPINRKIKNAVWMALSSTQVSYQDADILELLDLD